jgi:hypothetical protein
MQSGRAGGARSEHDDVRKRALVKTGEETVKVQHVDNPPSCIGFGRSTRWWWNPGLPE